MQIHCLLNQHYFFSLLLSTSDRNLLPLAPKQCGLLLWTWLCRSTREKELSLKRPCNLVGVKDGKNGTTYRRDWKRCTFSSQVHFFFFFFKFRERELGKDEVTQLGGKRVQIDGHLLSLGSVKIWKLETLEVSIWEVLIAMLQEILCGGGLLWLPAASLCSHCKWITFLLL